MLQRRGGGGNVQIHKHLRGVWSVVCHFSTGAKEISGPSYKASSPKSRPREGDQGHDVRCRARGGVGERCRSNKVNL